MMTRFEIRELRKGLKLTQQQFATDLGVALSTVQSWEAGTTSPSPMARALLEKIKEDKY
jgi:DNA-binding transcriptional regulator YiaG